jgi:hypothetical protein
MLKTIRVLGFLTCTIDTDITLEEIKNKSSLLSFTKTVEIYKGFMIQSDNSIIGFDVECNFPTYVCKDKEPKEYIDRLLENCL